MGGSDAARSLEVRDYAIGKHLWLQGHGKQRPQLQSLAEMDVLLQNKERFTRFSKRSKKEKYCRVWGNSEHLALMSKTQVYNEIITLFWNSAVKDVFETALKGRCATVSDVMKVLSLIINIFEIYFHEWHQEGWRPAAQAQGRATTYLNELWANTVTGAKRKPTER